MKGVIDGTFPYPKMKEKAHQIYSKYISIERN